MTLNKGKHLVKEINGKRCTLVEQDVNAQRAKFLKELLAFNGQVVHLETGSQPDTYNIGVEDLLFNPVIAVYERKLKNQAGQVVLPAYWNQLPIQEGLNYYEYGRKTIASNEAESFTPTLFK